MTTGRCPTGRRRRPVGHSGATCATVAPTTAWRARRPADSPQNASFPTTHDCPPPAALDIGGLPIAFDLTTACPTPLSPSAIACTSNTACPAAYPDCVQRNPGAFGPVGGGAHTITETGAPAAGDLTDGMGHPSTLVSIFCIQPTFNATVDAAGDLPGPGAVSLFGTAQLLP